MTTLFATFGSENCFKPQLLMRQSGMASRTLSVDVLAGETRSEAFTRLNPRGTVPFLVLDDGRTIAESNAMLLALGAGGTLWPEDDYGVAKAVEWMIFEQTRLEPYISPARFFTTIVPERTGEMAEKISDWQVSGTEGLMVLDRHLEQMPFMLGDAYTVADIAVFGYVHVADEGGFAMADFPAVSAWIARVKETPGFVSMAELWTEAGPEPFGSVRVA